MNLLIDLHYFTPVTSFEISNGISNIVFEQYEFHQKMSFRNRCQIAGADGLINLSIPLEKGRDQKTLVKNVRIAAKEDWQGQHWKTICSCYSKSPWFEFYRDELESIYRQRRQFLFDWNMVCFEWIRKVLPYKPAVGLTESWQPEYPAEEYLDWRSKLMPKNIAGFPAVKYHQVFEERTGFLPNLSILDLLFCEGKNAAGILNRHMPENG